MAPVEPGPLLAVLAPLLTTTGGTRGDQGAVDKLTNIMNKFGKKLVSKSIYIKILMSTDLGILEVFLAREGWDIVSRWWVEASSSSLPRLGSAVEGRTWALAQQLVSLLSMCPSPGMALRPPGTRCRSGHQNIRSSC